MYLNCWTKISRFEYVLNEYGVLYFVVLLWMNFCPRTYVCQVN